MRTNHRTFSGAEVTPVRELAPLDLAEIFGRVAPLEVDLGCGDGAFLAALAAQKPERNFLGVERAAGRFRGACRKIGDNGLSNARVLRSEILGTLQELLPAESVEVFHLLFPDPWPKYRHRSRRVFTDDFLHAIAYALKPAGVFRIATDQRSYFREMENVIAQASEFELLPNEESDIPATTFEQRFGERGLEIYRLGLRKISPPRNGNASQRSL